ncbi:hypothetical protein HF086_001940 [Spodoptera exigua]|uniref:Impact N-terminal domain-containing protein n=1 Tax=Spodoptera exigua TaxID=7107 RepID=A0A922SFL5_SPOEX|nr:hypothetical protein HF086_001940 [Spodoptera exigua]
MKQKSNKKDMDIATDYRRAGADDRFTEEELDAITCRVYNFFLQVSGAVCAIYRQSKAGSHGEVIVDRKSIFQGHATRVYSVDDVKQVQTHLVSPNKCSTTRIVNVKVTRWFGGIQIGPDRVRHITNASKQAIQQAGLLNK